MKKDVYQMVTERIVNELENGIIPWQQPWSGTGSCISYETGRPYSSLNCWLLGAPGEYITMAQCDKAGGRVKKGAKAKFVVFSKKHITTTVVTNEEGEEETKEKVFFTLRYYNVFNIEDCEGITPRWSAKKADKTLSLVEEAEKVVTDYEGREKTLKIHRANESGEAYYSPSLDEIVVPCVGQYSDIAEYYSTLYHEMVHSTGVKSRCDRGLGTIAAHGKNEYSQEELVAEIGSAMLVGRVGLDAKKAFRNSVAYIQSWLRTLKNDKKLLVVASSRAEKAVNYIMNEA